MARIMTHRERAERRQAVVDDLQAGKPNAEIAAAHGISAVYVSNIASALGLRETPASKTEQYKILKDLIEETPIPEIATKHGVTRAWVYQVLNEARKAGFNKSDGTPL